MHKPTTLALAIFVTGALLVPATASAVHDQGPSFNVGSSFRVGGLSISLVYGSRGTRWAPAYYYRVPAAIGYRGVSCTSSCFVHGGHYYHAPSCPVAGHYFHNHGFDAGHFWAPRARSVYVAPPVHRVYSRPVYRAPAYRVHVPPGHLKHYERGRGYGHYKHDKHDRFRGHRRGPSRRH